MSFCSHSTLNAIRAEVQNEEAVLEVLTVMTAQFPSSSVAGEALLTALLDIEGDLDTRRAQDEIDEQWLRERRASNADGGGFDVFTDRVAA